MISEAQINSLIKLDQVKRTARFEEKFRYCQLDSHKIRSWLINSQMKFFEIYTPRLIHSIYFDDHQLNSYFDNINGNARRSKVRLRFYDDDILNMNLEIKIKIGDIGYKFVKKFVHNFSSIDELLESFRKFFLIANFNEINNYKYNSFVLKQHKPIVLTSYKRRYYQSICNNFRITLDENIIYSSVEGLKVKAKDLTNICEFKQNSFDDNNFIKNYFPFPKCRNSKYINAINNCFKKN